MQGWEQLLTTIQLPQVEISRSCKDFILTHLRVIPKPTGLSVRLGGMCELTVQSPLCASQGHRGPLLTGRLPHWAMGDHLNVPNH